MADHTTAQLRNIAFVGHAGAGKTTLIERALFNAGVIAKAGSVDNGDTVCDYEHEEKEHGHSLNTAFVNFDHEDRHFNLIDSPGFPDFVGQAIGALPACETVACVIGADKGIQTMTRRLMHLAGERRFPRMIIVNKIDEHAGELEALVEQIRATFGAECLPLNLPTPDCSDVVDLWEKSEGETLFSSAAAAHQAIVDQAVEVDEALMETYLEQGEVTKDQLHDAFEKALREAHLVPIVFVSARTGAGVDDMLHLMAHLCPSPLEGNQRPFELTHDDGTTEPWSPDPADPDKAFVAHVFKVSSDQFVGKIAMLAVHQGTLKAGEQVYIGDSKKGVRLTHPQKVHGKEMVEVDDVVAGDIVAIGKIDELVYDTVVHAHDTAQSAVPHVRFKSIPMPEPMYGLAIEAKNRGDEAKISTALHKLAEEDPTFRVERIAATKQTVIRGMGDLHMRVLLEKLQHRFKLELDTQPPKVAYRETIRAAADGHHRHKKQTGGAGQFGEVMLTVEPLTNGQAEQTPADGLEFIDDTFGGSIPKQFMPAIEKGIRQAMEQGAVAGYPITGVRVRVTDGKHHPVDSKEVAFITAGKRAFIDAVRKAKPVLLEPVCRVEITAPSSAMGDISADLSSKRGQMGDTDYLPGDTVLIHAKVPLAEMQNYSSVLKSLTGGQGSYTMDYSHDDPTPPNVQQEIMARYAPADEDED